MSRVFSARLRAVLATVALAVAAGAAPAQVGHLNVPGAQMVRSDFNALVGLPANQYFAISWVRPDGTEFFLNAKSLLKQTLVYTDFVITVARTSSSNPAGPENGEVWIADFDAGQASRPLQDQWPLASYTIPAGLGKVLLHVPLPAGRAYSGMRQPLVVSYISPSVVLSVRGFGYVIGN